MSTSPIGTRVPTLAPNAIIRAGIPLSDNFNATDVAVSVESLLASGAWTPAVLATTFAEVPTVISAQYSKVGNVVNCSMFLSLELDPNKSSAAFTLSLPFATSIDGKDLIGIMAYSGDISEFLLWSVGYDPVNGGVGLGVTSATNGFILQYLHVMFQYIIA
jgi:hypothetical protein